MSSQKTIGFRVEADEQQIIQDAANAEHRKVANFAKLATLERAKKIISPNPRLVDLSKGPTEIENSPRRADDAAGDMPPADAAPKAEVQQ